MIARKVLRAVPFLVLLVLIPLLFSLSTPNASEFVLAQSTQTPSPAESIRHKIAEERVGGRTMQALYQVETLAAQTGWTPEWQRLAGDLWAEIGDLPTAVSYWAAASGSQTDDVVLARRLAEAYLSLQRWNDGVSALVRLTELLPDDGWAHYQLGLILAASNPQAAVTHLQAAAKVGDYADVANALLDTLSDDPASALVAMRVGMVLANHNLWPYAELAFGQAVVTSQTPAEALAYTGFARDQQGKDGGQWIERAVALNPDSPQVRYLQGLHLRAVGAYQESLDTFVLAAAQNPGNPAYYAELGTAYRLLGNLSQAEYWLRMAVQLSNDAPEFQSLLALFYAEEAPNLTDAGLNTLEQTATLVPDDPDVKAGLGWALYRAGRTTEGVAEIDAALKLAPDNPRALLYKARIWIENGQLEVAVPLLRQVSATSSPFAEEARRILANLGG